MLVRGLFNLLSDIHLEFLDHSRREKLLVSLTRQRNEDRSQTDVLVLAGDIIPSQEPYLPIFLEHVARLYPRVLYLPGNHEFYRPLTEKHRIEMQQHLTTIEAACNAAGVQLLHRSRLSLNDKMDLLACTLWFDPEHPLQRRPRLSDYSLIDGDDGHRFDPLALHKTDRQWLDRSLSDVAASGKQAIIVTHHMPFGKRLWQKLVDESAYPYLFEQSAGFTSDMDDIIEGHRPTILEWCFGHTHHKVQLRDGDICFTANPTGYPWEAVDDDA
jgi:UDP-2,3-diacylglucosamine pyrophosphatase LpxH